MHATRVSFGMRALALATALGATVALTAQVPAAHAAETPAGGSTPTDGHIWMPNYGAASVDEIDPATMQKSTTVPFVGDHPLVVRTNPDGSRLFVGNFGPFDWSVSVIDTASKQMIKKIPLLGAAYAVIQMSADGRHLYVPTSTSLVQVIDTTTLEVVRTIPILLPPGLAHLEVSPDESSIYAYGLATITRYDAHTGLPTAPPLFIDGITPGWGAINSDGSMLYAVNFWGGITWIDPIDWKIVRNVRIDPWNSNPISATLSPDGTELWVCNYSTDDVRILDAHTGEEKRRFSTNGAAVYIGFSEGGHKAYLTEVADGAPLPYFSPLVANGLYRAKDEAWFGPLLGLKTRVAEYDTATLQRGRVFETDGVYVSGVYPR